MPTRLHQGHVPPLWWDRPLAHPWSMTAVGLLWALVGARLLLDITKQAANADGVVANVPIGVALYLALSVGLGGIAVLAAVNWPGSDTVSWPMEMVGLIIGAGAWGVYALAPVDPYFRIIGACFVAGAVLRVTAAIVNRERWIRRDRQRQRRRARARLQGD